MPIELDHNATTRPLPSVVAAVHAGLTQHWHNPSATHRAGQDARHALDTARSSVARLLGVPARDLTFTSGATEAIYLGARAVLNARTPEARMQRRAIVTSPIEHEAVRELCAELLAEGAIDEVRELPVSRDGTVDTRDLSPIDEHVALVFCMRANNETGVIQPVERIAAASHEHGVLVLCDATQWVGKMPTAVRTRTNPDGLPVDLLTCSAHKMHGPKGIGALYTARGVPFRTPTPGTQERERRGGTESVPLIMGFAAAAEEAMTWLADTNERERLGAMRDRFESELLDRCPGASVNGVGAERLWNTANIAFPGLEAEALLLHLSERGVHASAGAACSSGSLEPSSVLRAMGVPDAEAHGSLRFSFSRETTTGEVVEAGAIIEEAVAKLREITA